MKVDDFDNWLATPEDSDEEHISEDSEDTSKVCQILINQIDFRNTS